MGWLDRIALQIGGLPARRVVWGLALVFSLWVVIDVFALQLTGGLAQSSYDAMVRARVLVASPDPRIVIIDIDEASLARMAPEFGRWPWPRDTLATVMNYLERQQPAAVVWDVLFADADQLSPGGDAALDEAAKNSVHSHFSVVRLPKVNDAASQITSAQLPGLWLSPGPAAAVSKPIQTATVAMIAPALPSVAKGRLGFNNGYVDADGVLRRYRYLERLADGSELQSLPLSVLNAIDKEAVNAYLERTRRQFILSDELVIWRQKADAYPRISFADVFAQAEGGKPLIPLPSFVGKVIIVGATAPSLHDIHPTPLSATQSGVDTLATALDNALNQRHLTELPRGLQALLAIGMCVALALWAQYRSLGSLAPALLVLPAVLLGISFFSLNGLPVFVDLHMAAGLALGFLAVLRYWSVLRRNYWCTPPKNGGQAMALLPLELESAWLDTELDCLIDALERHAPRCRVLVCDAHAVWPATLRWPELLKFAAVVGCQADVEQAWPLLQPALHQRMSYLGKLVVLDKSADRKQLAQCALRAWAEMHDTDFKLNGKAAS